jgi:serine/threonine-protein kinase
MSNNSQVDDFIGQILAERYEIMSFIGRGAMGSVYKARQIAIGRDVAIKMMLDQSIDERATQRFVKEAMAMSALNHPHLISIIDFGETPEGNPFLVMEFLEGTTLSKIIEKGLPLQQALKIVEQIAEGLAHAHARGFIHRDLKPSNVMLIGDSRDFVKIVDLGIVKALEKDAGAEKMRLTHTGEIFGSPLYMSPEQCLGQPLDERSDIYALGCLTYETITGEPPIIGENFVQTVYRHVHDIPSMMADCRPDLVIPPEVEGLVAKALSKNRDDRQGSMRELRDAISNARNACTAATLGAMPFVSSSAVSGQGTMGTRISGPMPVHQPSANNPAVKPYVSAGSESGGTHPLSDTGGINPVASFFNRPALVMTVVGCLAALLVFAGIGIAAMFSNFGSRTPPSAVAPAPVPAACPQPTGTDPQGKNYWDEPLITLDFPREPMQKKVVVLATDGADPGIDQSDGKIDVPENEMGDIIVDVQKTAGPFTLVLASQAKVRWLITGATEEVQAVRVIGFREQLVQGVDPKMVVASTRDQKGDVHFFTVRLPDSFEGDYNRELKDFEDDSIFLMIKDSAKKAAGDSPMTEFQGKRLGKKFIIK